MVDFLIAQSTQPRLLKTWIALSNTHFQKHGTCADATLQPSELIRIATRHTYTGGNVVKSRIVRNVVIYDHFGLTAVKCICSVDEKPDEKPEQQPDEKPGQQPIFLFSRNDQCSWRFLFGAPGPTIGEITAKQFFEISSERRRTIWYSFRCGFFQPSR